MKIAIVGAGAIGGFLAARLDARGHEVTLVGRGAGLTAIRNGGLLVRQADGSERRVELQAVERLDERPDLVLLTVKTQDVTAACQALMPLADGVPVVALQNGVRADELVAAVVGRDNVLGAVVMCAVSYTQPGEIMVQFPGWLIAGEPFGAPRARTRQIAGVLAGAVPTYSTANLLRTRWTKLIFNLNNGICAATGLTLPEVGQQELGRGLSVHVMKEGIAVARAAGIHLDHSPYGLTPGALRQNARVALLSLLQGGLNTVVERLPERAAVGALGLASRSRLNRVAMRGSTWQSIARGRASEIDYLNGEIVVRGKELGIATPYNARLVELVHQVERDQQFRPLEDLVPPRRAGAIANVSERREP
jgi:2-dehydropantoate 2-reductase